MTVELVEVMPVDAKVSVMLPTLVMDKPENVAVPLLAVTVVVPCKLPALAVAVTCAFEVVTLPYTSNTLITGCVPKAAPAVAVEDGWVEIPNCVETPPAIVPKLKAVPPGVDEVRDPSVTITDLP